MMKRFFLLLTLLAGLGSATVAPKVKALGIAAQVVNQAAYLPAGVVTKPLMDGLQSRAVQLRADDDVVNITAFGASKSATASINASAISKAVTAAAAAGLTLYIPVGTFATDSVTVTVPVQFAPGNSILRPAAGQTIVFTEPLTIDNSKHFDNALAGQGTVSFAETCSISAVYPQWWGAKANGRTESGASITAALAAAVTAHARVVFPSGTYAYATCPNFGFDGLVVEALGKVVLKHTGTGHALKIVEPTAAGIYNLEILGNFLVEGNPKTNAEGVLIESVHHSKIHLNGKGAPGSMFTVKWAVLTDFDLRVSINDGAFSVVPTTGVVIRENPGGYTSDSRFNLIIEGVSGIGIDVQYASGCTFSGTSEGNGTGLRDGAVSLRNTYNNLWFEANKVTDAALYGKDSVFINVHSQSLVAEDFDLIAAQNTKFIGGMLRQINLRAGSADTLFLGTATSDHPGLGIVGSGSQHRLGCSKLDTNYNKTSSYTDIP